MRKMNFSTLPSSHYQNDWLVGLHAQASISSGSIIRRGANGLNYKRRKSIKIFTLASLKILVTTKQLALNEFLKMSIYQPLREFLFQQICLIIGISFMTNFLRTVYYARTYTTTSFWPLNSFSRRLKIEKQTLLM